jgi:hypothetical protein
MIHALTGRSRGFTHFQDSPAPGGRLISRYRRSSNVEKPVHFHLSGPVFLLNACTAAVLAVAIGVSHTPKEADTPIQPKSSGFHTPTPNPRGFAHRCKGPALRGFTHFAPAKTASATSFRDFSHRTNSLHVGLGVSHTLQPVDSLGGSATLASGFHTRLSRGIIHRTTGYRPRQHSVTFCYSNVFHPSSRA